jgi:hypothetical protein
MKRKHGSLSHTSSYRSNSNDNAVCKFFRSLMQHLLCRGSEHINVLLLLLLCCDMLPFSIIVVVMAE